MLQDTIFRLQNFALEEPIIICNNEHRFIVAEQLRSIEKKASIILEPVGRNTAPAIALAAFAKLKATAGEDALLLVLSADHHIEGDEKFLAATQCAQHVALQHNRLVTFGIQPTYPETGYGYIKQGAPICDGAFLVDSFAEKPDFEIAESYLSEGGYLWNSGMFLFSAKLFLSELQAFRPDIYEACERAFAYSEEDLTFLRLDENHFSACPSESVDYAIFEKTRYAAVVALDAVWNDIGSWSALWDITSKDTANNVLIGDVKAIDAANTYVYSKDKFSAVIGIDNLVVVNTNDALLVAHKDRVQDVKKVVQTLQASGRKEYKEHTTSYRPWGSITHLVSGQGYQIKKINVHPGEGLSTQKHYNRSEHWTIVKGSANITVGETEHFLTENQSIYIPVGTVHSLENPGKIDLEIIEVRSGDYLGEDDIVRIKDRYGRA